MSNKYFVLDTNVLLHNPGAIYSFTDNTVVIPITVIEELDTFKSASDKKGKHARQVLREIDAVSKKGALTEGAKLKNGGKLKIAIHPPEDSITIPLDLSSKDNKILAVAIALQSKGEQVFFISKDINARIKALALGIKANDYEKQKVEYASLYRGWRKLTLPEEEIAQFYQDQKLAVDSQLFFDNEYVCLICKDTDEDPKALGRYDHSQKAILPIKPYFEAMGIKPVNLEQQFAFDLLLNDDISLVTLVGQAGTGKTLIALACALQKIIGKHPTYEKLLVARPIIPLGKDIGYLPGTKDQKLNYWMQPIFDNLAFIMQKDKDAEEAKHNAGADKQSSKFQDKIDYLLDTGLIEIEAITYIRGRSIPNQIMIIDEAQNLTPHEMKTIISRVGEGTKIILTGDPEQIDNPYLDANSNGLSYVADRFKNHSMTGHIFLSKSERSALASLAAELL